MSSTAELRMIGSESWKNQRTSQQLSTFRIAHIQYGIDVTRVQEVVKPLQITPIPLAPIYVRGLINLRGQVATAIGLRQLFGLPGSTSNDLMNVVCKVDGSLISLQVDEIGDVIEVGQNQFEASPRNVSEDIKRFMSGIYKLSDSLLSAIDVDRINRFLNQK